ncbi:MAG TPA: CsbD family protein [Chloroflexota bacterium]|nr:CsbD family protein [Chloroflexota bacterium]
MGERIDELKGNLKEGVGKVTGDRDVQAEGRAERDTAHATREVKGAGNQMKGTIEEGLGKVTGDDETRARGVADRLKGDTERAG